MAREGVLPGERLVRHHTDGVQVAAYVGRSALPYFRRRVSRSSGQSIGAALTAAHSGVGNLHHSARAEQDVSRFQVAVNFAVAVKMSEAAQQPGEDVPHVIGRLRLPHPARPVTAFDELHRVVGLARRQGAPVEDLDQVLVADLAEGVELASEKGGLGGSHQLQGKLAVADRILDPVHTARPALAEEGADLVPLWN